jgi:hypothetical protein
MRSRLITAVLLASLGAAVGTAAEKNDGSLDSIAWATAVSSAAPACPLLLTASIVRNPDGYVLRFTLKNTAGRPLTFNRHDLPWGNVDSIQTAAVTTEGQLVLGGYPIEDDFGLDRVSVQPNETLTGDYALSHRWSDGFPRKATIVLMWAYKVRAEQIPAKRWPVCSGVTSFKVPG